MSLRPRFAGDGRLRLPASVTIRRADEEYWRADDIVGEHGASSWDPFERTAEGLLLAEAFARVDLSQPRQARQWYQQHGVLELARFFPENDAFGPERDPADDGFHERLDDVLDQQDNVRWHLLTLARLSMERQRAGAPCADRHPHEGWDTAWAQPAIACPGEVIWLGGASYQEARIFNVMADYPSWEEAPADRRGEERVGTKEFRERWWPVAHAAARRIVEEGIPFVTIPWVDWAGHWYQFDMDRAAPHGRLPTGPLYVDWHGLLDLQRRLLTPYVQRAAVHDVVVGQSGSEGEALAAATPGANVGPVRVEQRRLWRSLLAPVYLQLLEGLRRVSEGQSGATWCRECGQPFLTLDARRSSFCNDRERFRFAQRERRRRLSARPAPLAMTR